MSTTFLNAEWRKLVMVNYEIDPSILQPYLPHKTEIDLWQDKCFVSLVGFMFNNTKLLGIKVPFHINFEEVNLRFYVKYLENGLWKRGVVFIKEIVPKPALTFIANKIYKEHYETMPMRHKIENTKEQISVSYSWQCKSDWNTISVSTINTPLAIIDGSKEGFITEHYWGYTKLSATQTSEYEVQHPKWHIYQTLDYAIDVDFRKVYGEKFDFLSTTIPDSVFLAEGSEITVIAAKKYKKTKKQTLKD